MCISPPKWLTVREKIAGKMEKDLAKYRGEGLQVPEFSTN